MRQQRKAHAVVRAAHQRICAEIRVYRPAEHHRPAQRSDAVQSSNQADYSFGGQVGSENIEHLLLQKNDGTFRLVVGRDVSEWTPAENGSPGSYPALSRAGTSGNSERAQPAWNLCRVDHPVHRERRRSDDLQPDRRHRRQLRADRDRLALPRIYRILPGVAPAPARAPAIASSAAHWSLDEGPAMPRLTA